MFSKEKYTISISKDKFFKYNFEIFRVYLIFKLIERKKEKCERSQLWSMDWCGERPFGHRASHHICVNNFDKLGLKL